MATTQPTSPGKLELGIDGRGRRFKTCDEGFDIGLPERRCLTPRR